MKRIISLLIVMSMLFTCVNASAINDAEKIVNESSISVKGHEWYYMMEPVSDESALDYTLQFNFTKNSDGNVELQGTISSDLHGEYPIEIKATPYVSQNLLIKDKGGYTLLPIDSNVEIKKFIMMEQAVSECLLIPLANDGLVGQSVISLKIQSPWSDGDLCFEGALPETFDFYATMAYKSHVIVPQGERRPFSSSEIIVPEEEVEKIQDELSVYEANIDFDLREKILADLPEYDGDTYFKDEKAEKLTGGVSTRAIPGRHDSGIPYAAFYTAGKWTSTNNPSFQTLGYYVETLHDSANYNNYESIVISWEYLYDSGTTVPITSGKGTGTGIACIRVRDAGVYFYNSSNGSIMKTSGNSYFQLKNAAMAVGLQSSSEIFNAGEFTSKLTKFIGKSKFISYIGLVNKNLGAAANVLDQVLSYGPVSSGTPGSGYQSTVALQIMTYGNVIRAQKITVKNGEYLMHGGFAPKYVDGDNLQIKYSVHHPTDKSVVKGKHYVKVRYFFEVHVKSGTSYKRQFDVQETRTGEYTVA